MNIIIRDIPQATLDGIKQAVKGQKLTQQEVVLRVLNREFGDPPTVLGYIKFDRNGDFDTDSEDCRCPACGQPAASWWLQVASNGELHRMCNVCAISE